MRYAVFSDVHANLEALEAFIEHAARRRVDRYMCLGDMVGYGPNPNRCIARVRELPEAEFILGNHDQAAAGAPYNMHKDAQRAILWTRERLTPENLRFLQAMKPMVTIGRMIFCHATPCEPLRWDYVRSKEDMRRAFSKIKNRILFIGHTHVAAVLTRRNFYCIYLHEPRNKTVVPAAELNRQIYNCGSVGQPRDGDPRASYLVYDTASEMVEFHRIAYDHDRAAAKILSAGLPDSLASRLIKGS